MSYEDPQPTYITTEQHPDTRNPSIPFVSTTLQFRFINNKEYMEHCVSLNTTVAEVKLLVENKFGYLPTYLLLNGIKLEARKSLADYGIIDGDFKTVHINING